MKLGLALGGGGARGAAHIGVLAELERLNIKPALITGTSIGGVIGALWAAGLKTPAITDFFQKLNLSQMYAFPENSPSISSNKKARKLLKDTLGEISFADLQIPLSVVTTDLVSRQVVVLDDGDLITAILATVALPTILPPIEMDGMVLVDGGVLNSIPFDVVRARGATFVIAVDLTNTARFGEPDELPPPTPTGVISRMLIRTQQRRTWQIVSTVHDIITSGSLNARLAISRPDILLRPDLGTIGIFDFHRWEEGIAAGQETARSIESNLHLLTNQTKNDTQK